MLIKKSYTHVHPFQMVFWQLLVVAPKYPKPAYEQIKGDCDMICKSTNDIEV